MKMHMSVSRVFHRSKHYLAKISTKMWKMEGKLISPPEILSVFYFFIFLLFLFPLLKVVMKGNLIGFVKKIKKVFNWEQVYIVNVII